MCRRKQVDAAASGRDAETKFRVGGRDVSKEEFQQAQIAKQPKRQPRYLEEDVTWKGGLVQRRAAEAQTQAEEEEVSSKISNCSRSTDEDRIVSKLRHM
jgi:hypothetical protein